MRLLIVMITFVSMAFAYPSSTVYVGDVGARTVTINNSGPLGGSQVTTMPIGAAQKFKIWFSQVTEQHNVKVNKGSESSCSNPCSVSFNTELGQLGRMYEITDSTGTSYTPPKLSSWEFMKFTPQPDYTAPFTIPMPVHGFRNFTKYLSFSVPSGEATNDLSVLLWTNNLRNSIASVITNNGTEHVLNEFLLTDVSSNGTNCAITTWDIHNFVAGDSIQFNRFEQGNGQQLNLGTYSVLSSPAPTAHTFSVGSCGVSSGTLYPNFGPAGQANGQTATKVFRYMDERRWFGGLHGNRQALLLSVPVGSSEFTANATNRMGIRYLGRNMPASGEVDGLWMLDFNVIHAPIEMTQIVVSSGNATATLTSSVPASWTVGRTVYLWDAPGPRWRFNGRHVITAVAGSTFTFAWGSDIPGETAGSAPYTTTNGTYTIPTSQDTTQVTSPHMYAALAVIPEASFQYQDPSTFNYGAGSVSNGLTLITSNLPGVSTTGCSGCHIAAIPGWDFKYFNAPPEIIKIVGMSQGRSEAEMTDVIAYIGSLNTWSTKGRWYNPPYQPCPGLDSGQAADWTAGCGQEWVLTYDKDMGEFLTPGGTPPDWTVASGASYANWYTNQDIKIHEQPLPIILPHWSRWLLNTQPENVMTTLGVTWTSYGMYTDYVNTSGNLILPQTLAAGINATVTTMTTGSNYGCTTNDYVQIESSADTPEYVKVTAGCGTTSQTISRGCAPIAGTCTGTGTAHTTSSLLADFTAYKRSGYMLGIYLDFANSSPLFDIVYKTLSGSTPLIKGPEYPNAQPGCSYPSSYLPNYYVMHKWASLREFEAATVYRLNDMYDVVTRDNFGVSTVNARVASQYTRGFMGYGFFGNGPHKTTGCDPYFLNTDDISPQNHDADSSDWYILADIVNNDDRLNYQFGPIDWNYYQAFNASISTYRPMFFIHVMQTPFNIQQTLGWSDLMANGNLTSTANILQLSGALSYVFGFARAQLFTSQSAVGDTVKQIALIDADMVSLFTATQWNTFITDTTVNTCTGAQPGGHPSVSFGQVYGSCLSDYVAAGLALMKYFGADSTSLNTLVAWANAVTTWTSGGYNFNSAITTAVCSWDSSQPPAFVRCHD